MKTGKLFYGLIFLFIAGCNQHKADSTTHEHDSTTAKTEQPGHDETTLSLNEGKKWKLDETTRFNMNETKQVFQQTAEKSNPNYIALATDLQDRANKLVSECKMSGKDHDMLHLWLEKYLSTIKELRAPETTTQEAAFHKIEEQLKSFDHYFE